MTHETLQLLNRFAFQPDGWFQIVPLGEYPHEKSGLVQVLDETATRRMAEDFANRARRADFPGLLIDFDHESHDSTKSSQAAGWIVALQNRADGLWARVRWTDVGEAALRNGRFRLISPVFERRSAEDLGNSRVRPVRLLDAGLTNDPNLTNIPPLSNRGGATPADSTEPTQMKTVLLALGLSPDASEPAALEAVNVLKNRAGTAEQQVADFKNRATTAEGELKSLRESTADSDLARFKNRIPQGTDAFWRGNLITNRADTLKALEGLPAPGGSDGKTSGKGKILNRAAADTPESRKAEGAEGDQPTPSEKLVREVEAYRLANRCTTDQAWTALRATKPELFAALAGSADDSATA